MGKKFDFSGWATKNDLLCADGRIIRRDAFKDNDGQTVPLVYQHQHTDPTNILGHALLENRAEGVYAYCSFNDTEPAQHVKTAVEHGDVVSLSIYANHLVQKGKDVLHGAIREVSVVLAGANPGAYIDNPIIVHGEGTDNVSYEENYDEAVIYTDESISLFHKDPEDEDEKKEEKEAPKAAEKKEEEPEMAEDTRKKAAEPEEDDGETVQDVFDSLTDKQKKVVYFMIGKALEDAEGDADEDEDDEEDEGDIDMKHNVFEGADYGPVISHADGMDIIANAKKYGATLKNAFDAYLENNELTHADGYADVSGFTSYPNGTTPAGVDALFPEFHDVRPGAPELVTNNLGWVDTVLNGANKIPYSRIRTSQVDIREIEEIRARGYAKGKEKVLAGNYAVAKRATSPATVYVRSALNHDDILDITDFDYVAFQYNVDKIQLRNELARAILIGDGRDAASTDKINEENVRPIWTDPELYVIHKTLDLSNQNGTNTAANFGENYLYAQAVIAALLDAKIDYRGSGNMVMFCEQSFFNKMMLAKDLNGRNMYQNKNELMSALDVSAIHAVSDFANKTRTVNGKTMKLRAIVGDMRDYTIGSVKGGEITSYKQFDIDFNQEKSLLETRVCGAVTKIGSFIVIEEEVSGS